eukprot:4787204-Amphidinium_carterae.1
MWALDALWRFYIHEAAQLEKASEVALMASTTLRGCPIAWQRAVCLTLKALAFEGRWEECWMLAATELTSQPSRE